jgi:hypothetical protein
MRDRHRVNALKQVTSSSRWDSKRYKAPMMRCRFPYNFCWTFPSAKRFYFTFTLTDMNHAILSMFMPHECRRTKRSTRLLSKSRRGSGELSAAAGREKRAAHIEHLQRAKHHAACRSLRTAPAGIAGACGPGERFSSHERLRAWSS